MYEREKEDLPKAYGGKGRALTICMGLCTDILCQRGRKVENEWKKKKEVRITFVRGEEMRGKGGEPIIFNRAEKGQEKGGACLPYRKKRGRVF